MEEPHPKEIFFRWLEDKKNEWRIKENETKEEVTKRRENLKKKIADDFKLYLLRMEEYARENGLFPH